MASKKTKEEFLALPGVREKINQIAKKHGFSPDELITIIQKESNFDPNVSNHMGSGAYGLIQFMPETAKDLGTSTAKIKKMGIMQQLDLVDKFFKRNHTKGGNPYLTVAYPKANKMDGKAVIGGPDSKIAKQNPAWTDENGNVTPDSIAAYADPKIYEEDKKYIEGYGNRNYINEAREEFKKDNPELYEKYELIKKRKEEFDAEAKEYDKYLQETERLKVAMELEDEKDIRFKELQDRIKRDTAIYKKNPGNSKPVLERIKKDEAELKELAVEQKPTNSRSALNDGLRGVTYKRNDSRRKELGEELKQLEQKGKALTHGGITPHTLRDAQNKRWDAIKGSTHDVIESRSQEIAKSAVDEYEKRKKRHSSMERKNYLEEGQESEADKIINETEKNKAVSDFDKELQNFMQETSDDVIQKEEFTYDKKNFKKKFSPEAVMYGALGAIGAIDANQSLPRYEDEVDMATMAYLQETKRLKERGLPVDVEAKVKHDLNTAYKAGMDNLTRASGGDRNLVLGNMAGLDIARAKGLTNLAIADQEAKDKAFQAYGDTLKHIDKFERDKNQINHRIATREVAESRADGKALANSAFSTMMKEIQYQKENAPGSANHLFTTYANHKLFGQTHDALPGTSGSAEDAAKKYDAQKKVIEEGNAYNKSRRDFAQTFSAFSPELKEQAKKENHSVQSLFDRGVTTSNDLNTLLGNSQPEASPPMSDQVQPTQVNPLSITQPNDFMINSIDDLAEYNRKKNILSF